eukprot:symbB.v1.2.011056.t1/scaffold728.1/size168468/4
MHLPDAWGYVVFADEVGKLSDGSDAKDFVDPTFPARHACACVYYACRAFHEVEGRFPGSWEELYSRVLLPELLDAQVSLRPRNDGYVAQVAVAGVVPRSPEGRPAERQALISGTGEALATVLVSEMGDKTFFLTMILAMRKSRRLALLASQSALWVMMLVSTSIGVLLRRLTLTVGDAMIIRFAAAGLMILFGLQSFRELSAGEAEDDDEKGAAHTQIEGVLTKAKRKKSKFLDVFRFAVLIFLAEWGDRSMLATITLATTKSAFGVLVGGCCGHLVAGTLAVVAGHFLEEHVSDRMVKITGGTLFILFGVSTFLNVW